MLFSSSILIHCTFAVAVSTASIYAVGTQLDKLVVFVSTYLVILAVTVAASSFQNTTNLVTIVLRFVRYRIGFLWATFGSALNAGVRLPSPARSSSKLVQPQLSTLR